MSRYAVLAASLALSLGACTWVKMEPDGVTVRVARAGDSLSSCTKKGEVSVSVRDKVGLYQRNDLKVRDELETMARNEASTLAADTVQPLNEPSGGEQRFAAYQCGSNYAPRRATPTTQQQQPAQFENVPPQGEAETFPIQDD